MRTFLLYFVTAIAEMVRMLFQWLWLRQTGCGELAAVAWLLTLHDTLHPGRVYAAYGGANMGVEIFWLRLVDGVRRSAWDIAGVAVALAATQATLHSSRVWIRTA